MSLYDGNACHELKYVVGYNNGNRKVCGYVDVFNWRNGLIRGSATKKFIGRRGRYPGPTYPESMSIALPESLLIRGVVLLLFFLLYFFIQRDTELITKLVT